MRAISASSTAVPRSLQPTYSGQVVEVDTHADHRGLVDDDVDAAQRAGHGGAVTEVGHVAPGRRRPCLGAASRCAAGWPMSRMVTGVAGGEQCRRSRGFR